MSWAGPKNPKRQTCGVKATGARAQAMRARMKAMQERHQKGLDPFSTTVRLPDAPHPEQAQD